MAMSKTGIGCVVALVVVAIVAIGVVSSIVGVWNTLNANQQKVDGGKSTYSAALNTCTQSIKGVWAVSDQYMKHESQTFKDVAQARSGYAAAEQAYQDALKTGDTKELTTAGAGVVQAALAFRIQIEAYPELKAIEATKENIRNLEASVNQIKTALDDWIKTIKDYNTYRGSAWPSIVGGFMSKFPSSYPYYEGDVQKLNMDDLNPQK